MSITTKTGDDGETGLLFSRRTGKDDPRIAACGDVDELNAAIGLAKAHLQNTEFAKKLTTIQQALIALMGELATLPEDAGQYAKAQFDKLTAAATAKLDERIGELEGGGLSFTGWALPKLPATIYWLNSAWREQPVFSSRRAPGKLSPDLSVPPRYRRATA